MKLKVETWVNIASGVVALVGVVISVFALNMANEALDAQKEESLRMHAASIYAVHNAEDDTFSVAATESDKSLYHVVMIFPTACDIENVAFELPNLTVDFDRIRKGVARGISEKQKKRSERIRMRIPVGILTLSIHQGGSYSSGNMYSFVADYWVPDGQADPQVEFVALANVRPIDMPGFVVFKAPWKTLTEPEIDEIAFERRTKDIRGLVDRYWDALVIDNHK